MKICINIKNICMTVAVLVNMLALTGCGNIEKNSKNDSKPEITITDLPVNETYSCNGGEYFYTFESCYPQFSFNNSIYSEQEAKLNKIFSDLQLTSNLEYDSENSILIDRKAVEKILSENHLKNTYTKQTYSVPMIEDDCLTVIVNSQWYGGGAHGGNVIRTYFVDILNGDVLDMSDLFNDTDEFIDYICDYFYNTYSDEYSKLLKWNKDDLYKGIRNEKGGNWYINENCLYVEYGDYALGSYADGHQLLCIPLDNCKDYQTDKFRELLGN